MLTTQNVEDFRTRLLSAAARAFAAQGIEGVTMRALARQLGVSPMTPYRYFHDKEEILAAVRAQAFDDFAARLEAARRSIGSAGRKGRAVGEAYLRFALDEPEAYRLIFDLSQPNEDRYPEILRARERARKTMTAYMEDLVSEGRLTGDPYMLGLIYWAGAHGLVCLFMAGKLDGEKDLRKAYAAMMETFTRGAGAPHNKA